MLHSPQQALWGYRRLLSLLCILATSLPWTLGRQPGIRMLPSSSAWLQTDWVAALRQGTPVLAGDLNARTTTARDWPGDQTCSPRSSCDRSSNNRWHWLLRFCVEYGARICNGRVSLGVQHMVLEGLKVLDLLWHPP